LLPQIYLLCNQNSACSDFAANALAALPRKTRSMVSANMPIFEPSITAAKLLTAPIIRLLPYGYPLHPDMENLESSKHLVSMLQETGALCSLIRFGYILTFIQNILSGGHFPHTPWALPCKDFNPYETLIYIRLLTCEKGDALLLVVPIMSGHVKQNLIETWPEIRFLILTYWAQAHDACERYVPFFDEEVRFNPTISDSPPSSLSCYTFDYPIKPLFLCATLDLLVDGTYVRYTIDHEAQIYDECPPLKRMIEGPDEISDPMLEWYQFLKQYASTT
jgi:hypothetical protein